MNTRTQQIIKRTGHVANKDANVFYKDLNLLVDQFQNDNLEVEIQYQTVTSPSDYGYSALVIGREIT